ncbi:MAG: OmpA family protein [Acidimicrobiia bacterium]
MNRLRARPHRSRRLAVVFALAVAACGGNGAEDVTTTPAPTTTQAAPSTTEPVPSTTTTPPEPIGSPQIVWSTQYANSIDDLVVAPDNETVWVAERATYVHQLADGLLLDAVVYERHFPLSVDIDPTGAYLSAGLGLYGVVITDTTTGEVVLELDSGFESAVAFSPAGDHVATGDRSGVVRIWSLDTGSEVAVLEDAGAAGRGGSPVGLSVVSLEYDPPGDLLAVVHFDCVANVWDVGTREIVSTLELETGEGSCWLSNRLLRFSPDGQLLAGVISEDGSQLVRFWGAGGVPVMDLEVLPRVRDLAFSPDGTMLVVASRLGTTIWDLTEGVLLYEFDETFDATASQQPVAATFTLDGGHVVIARADNMLELWRLPGAEPLVAPEREECEPLPLPGDVLFDTGSSELRAEADAVLTELAESLAARFPVATLTFVGHTDSRGSAEVNQQLSVARAASVGDWFEAWASVNGVDGWVLLIDGRGATELKTADTDADGAFLAEAGALNRRVEIEIEAEGCA